MMPAGASPRAVKSVMEAAQFEASRDERIKDPIGGRRAATSGAMCLGCGGGGRGGERVLARVAVTSFDFARQSAVCSPCQFTESRLAKSP